MENLKSLWMKRALTLEVSCDTYHRMNATGW